MPRRNRGPGRDYLNLDRDKMIIRESTRVNSVGQGERRRYSQPIPRPLVNTAAARKQRLGHPFSSAKRKIGALRLNSIGFQRRERLRSLVVRKRLWHWHGLGWEEDSEWSFLASRRSSRLGLLVVMLLLLLVESHAEAWWTPGSGVSWQVTMQNLNTRNNIPSIGLQ